MSLSATAKAEIVTEYVTLAHQKFR